jgi:hypothetical protein
MRLDCWSQAGFIGLSAFQAAGMKRYRKGSFTACSSTRQTQASQDLRLRAVHLPRPHFVQGYNFLGCTLLEVVSERLRHDTSVHEQTANEHEAAHDCNPERLIEGRRAGTGPGTGAGIRSARQDILKVNLPTVTYSREGVARRPRIGAMVRRKRAARAIDRTCLRFVTEPCDRACVFAQRRGPSAPGDAAPSARAHSASEAAAAPVG